MLTQPLPAVALSGNIELSDWRRWMAPLNVLLVARAFPPENIIGAVRIGKLAKYLEDRGHDVRVVAATPTTGSLPLEIPRDHVVYAEGWAADQVFDKPIQLIRRLRRGTKDALPSSPRLDTAATGQSGLTGGTRSRWSETLTRHYYALVRIPDARAGWIPAATAAAYKIVRDWRPDIVIGSAPSNSALVVASRIARACGAPWIAELRDLWADDPYYEEPAWRYWLDRFLEWRVLSQAAGLVSVTPQWTESLRRRYRQPVACILNGYVEADFPPDRKRPPPGDVVTILYTGNIYAGFRDPTPLFRALAMIGEERKRVAVHFYGPTARDVLPLAKAQGAADCLYVHDPVPYKESLALQTAADVLLLLQWNNVRDAGNIPGKFFEYLGAGRPILLLGYEQGDLAATIRERRAGVVANEPEAIAQQLCAWIAQKPTGIPPVDPAARAGMSREEQFQKYEAFVQAILLAEAGLPANVSVPSAPAALLP